MHFKLIRDVRGHAHMLPRTGRRLKKLSQIIIQIFDAHIILSIYVKILGAYKYTR